MSRNVLRFAWGMVLVFVIGIVAAADVIISLKRDNKRAETRIENMQVRFKAQGARMDSLKMYDERALRLLEKIDRKLEEY